MSKPDQYCVVCGVIAPRGPRGFEWDVHRLIAGVAGEMHNTCSRECREKLGLSERKIAADPAPPDVEGW